jgi:DNA replication protein DnaC
MSAADALVMHLKTLRMPTAAVDVAEVIQTARQGDWSPEDFARELLEREIEGRRRRRVERILGGSRLPPGKTLATLETNRLPLRIRRLLPDLCTGEFVDRADNVLVFGLPGRGKTHFACSVGYELAQSGRTVLFTSTFKIVGRLVRAKRDLEFESELRRLDRFEVLILDDIGYVQQDREEMEVLFTLLAERYERRSVIITSNLVFSEWDRIFKDPLTTMAAIDRVVHHSIIVEFGKEAPSIRAEDAANRSKSKS